MARMPEETLKFMDTHGVRNDEVWQVPGGKAWAVKHSALERIATQRAILFAAPDIIEKDGPGLTVSMIVHAKMKTDADEEITTWSIGEVGPSNYRVTGKQAGYPWAMAEKRAKDRCILKLLGAHGALYSDSEADAFTEPQQLGGDEQAQDQLPLDNTPINDVMYVQVLGLLKETNTNTEAFCRYFEVANPAQLPQRRFDEAIAQLRRKLEKGAQQ